MTSSELDMSLWVDSPNEMAHAMTRYDVFETLELIQASVNLPHECMQLMNKYAFIRTRDIISTVIALKINDILITPVLSIILKSIHPTRLENHQ